MSNQDAVYSLQNSITESEYPEDLYWTYERRQENAVSVSSTFHNEFPVRQYKALKQPEIQYIYYLLFVLYIISAYLFFIIIL